MYRRTMCREECMTYLCPSLNLIKCRTSFKKENDLNLPVFCHKISPNGRPFGHILDRKQTFFRVAPCCELFSFAVTPNTSPRFLKHLILYLLFYSIL